MEKEIYETRVIPLVKIVLNGGKKAKIDNLSHEEIRNMSCDPRMLWETGERVYVAEMPLTYKGGTSVKWSLFYVFDELTKEEQEKYFDRSIIIHTTIKDVVKVYDDKPGKLFGKRKTKKRN